MACYKKCSPSDCKSPWDCCMRPTVYRCGRSKSQPSKKKASDSEPAAGANIDVDKDKKCFEPTTARKKSDKFSQTRGF